jgi:excisionase family DNA binding protein
MFLTAAEAAKKLHCNADTVRRLAAAGNIPARKVGRRWLFEPEQLRAFVRGEWHSTNDRPADPGGLDSQYAVSLFDAAPALRTGSRPKNTRRPFALVSGDKST